MLKNSEGKKIQNVNFQAIINGKLSHLKSDEIFKGKKVVVFALPGAFTPTCSSSHVPRFNKLAPLIKKQGIDEIVCVSVNDAFVMDAWQKDQDAENIRFVADGNGLFSEAVGMLVDKSDIGFGKRSWRYSMLVNDGSIEKMFIEAEVPGDPFEVSDADTMLGYLNAKATEKVNVTIFTKPGCPFCAKAKDQLREHGYLWEEVQLNKDVTLRSVKNISGQSSVPQIYIDGKYIGDSVALEKYLLQKK